MVHIIPIILFLFFRIITNLRWLYRLSSIWILLRENGSLITKNIFHFPDEPSTHNPLACWRRHQDQREQGSRRLPGTLGSRYMNRGVSQTSSERITKGGTLYLNLYKCYQNFVTEASRYLNRGGALSIQTRLDRNCLDSESPKWVSVSK